MQENVDNRLEITDYDFEVIEAAVEYFYDQEGLQFYDLDILVDCLQFAVEYDMGDFKNKLEHYLFFRVYPDTFCQIANASISYNLMKLKEFCLDVFDLYVEHSMAVDDFEMLDPAFVEEMHTE
uniref:Uncharacterized protein n=1 Tax=Panagrolaimus davidi TaxID=227884 RepID=A0A914PE61_9BILA